MGIGKPMPLAANKGKSFIGSYVLGMGFILTHEEAQSLIEKDPRNKDVLFPYLNGDDLNTDPEQKPSRWVINFFEWDEEKAKTYPDCYEIVKQKVKAERLTKNDQRGREKWWQFLRVRRELYNAISELDQVMVIPLVSKYSVFDFSPTNTVFMHKLGVIVLNNFHNFTILSSTIHNIWAWKYSSTLGSGTLNYSTTDCFENFPFPINNEINLEYIGSKYHKHRKLLMIKSKLGLTKIYNIFHSKGIKEGTNLKDKNVLYLKKHLEKCKFINYEQIVDDIKELRKLHIQMDKAVMNIYGWDDIQLDHDFYELEYLPENDRVRFTISPIARKEILKRLLLLNLQQHNEQLISKGNIYTNSSKKNKILLETSNNTLFPES